MGHGDEPSRHASKHDIEHGDVGAEAKRLHFSGFCDDLAHGDTVPQTPIEVADGEVVDDTPLEQMMSPAKASRRDDSGGVSLLNAIRNIEHLDIEPEVPIQSDDVDVLIQHELNLEEDFEEVELGVNASLKELCFPYSAQGPDLPPECKDLMQSLIKWKSSGWLDLRFSRVRLCHWTAKL
jgi:hypothetical protein